MGLRLHGWRTGRSAPRPARRQGRRDHRNRGERASRRCPPLAESAKHLYVFQRTPSAIGVRGNRPTPDDFADGLEPGWQRQRMENFSAVMTGVPVPRDLTDDGWTHHMARVTNPEIPEGMSLDEIMRDGRGVRLLGDGGAPLPGERDRRRPERVAESLKPYYRYMCKRPCFHDEYLPTFNRATSPSSTAPPASSGSRRGEWSSTARSIALDCII